MVSGWNFLSDRRIEHSGAVKWGRKAHDKSESVCEAAKVLQKAKYSVRFSLVDGLVVAQLQSELKEW